MTELSLLRQIMGTNQSYLSGVPRLLNASGDPFVVIACIDPRLTGLLEPAMGLPRHRAIVIRTAGNQLGERTRDELRSIAVALYVKKAGEILVVGHTDCGMYNFSVAEVTENFRKAGIPRTAFGNEDLRTWFGAFSNVRDNVIGSIAFLRKSGIVPGNVRIHGLMLDTASGAIEVVLDGDLVTEVAAPAQTEPAHEESPAQPAKTEAPGAPAPPPATLPVPGAPPEAAPKKGPIIVGAPAKPENPPPPPPNSLLEAALILRDAFHRERQNHQMQKSIADIRAKWQSDRNPSRIFDELQKLAHLYEARYPRVPGALAYLQDAIRSGHADKIGFGEVLKRIFD